MGYTSVSKNVNANRGYTLESTTQSEVKEGEDVEENGKHPSADVRYDKNHKPYNINPRVYTLIQRE